MADKLARAKLARAAARLNGQTGPIGLPPLILMTDDERLADPLAAVRALPRGSMVILRTRRDADRLNMAIAIHAITRARDLTLLIADDPDVATRIGADGLHLPEAQAREAAYWRALHPRWTITAAAHSLSACLNNRYADAVIVGPAFSTLSHPGGRSFGVARLLAIARQNPVPIYALGGINSQNVQRLAGGKLAGIAAISALSV